MTNDHIIDSPTLGTNIRQSGKRVCEITFLFNNGKRLIHTFHFEQNSRGGFLILGKPKKAMRLTGGSTRPIFSMLIPVKKRSFKEKRCS